MTIALEVRHLSIDYVSKRQPLKAVEDVSFEVKQGRSLALVGESGCGKTTTMLALMRLLPREGRIVSGQILCNGVDLLQLSENQMRQYRWQRIGIVFQGAMNALNPVQKVGHQIAEAMVRHEQRSWKDASQRAGELMEIVGIQPERAQQYPHQFSGGMRQRVMIAMALACKPDILIADEPTTALDVMVQAQILEILQSLQKELGLAVIIVTHDLGVVAEVCDEVLVMYGGKTAEYGTVADVFSHPLHPYTRRLLQAFPDIDNLNSTLASIPGHPPALHDLPQGCRFEPRCARKSALCNTVSPSISELRADHFAACHHPEEGNYAN
ncbi:MAG: ABC transporter ATP-binding protein [Anaerolineae bacterium]